MAANIRQWILLGMELNSLVMSNKKQKNLDVRVFKIANVEMKLQSRRLQDM